MVALRKPGWLSRADCSQRATAAAFKVGAKVHKKRGGATPELKELMRMYRESLKAD